jgi:heme a synthase
MNTSVPAVDWSPLGALLGLAAALALGVLVLLWQRHRDAAPSQKLAVLTAVTLFLTFDLVIFGAFTRLSDSGLGCPDWPGCYGQASPLAAHDEIRGAQQAMPTGPVTLGKAWIEMIHRYLAMLVGALILALAAASFVWRRHLPHAMAWPLITLAWVIVQGLFGKYTVVWKLYPAVVTLHLLGAMALLALLAAQREAYRRIGSTSAGTSASTGGPPMPLRAPLRALAITAAIALAVQITLGGWVSTNYAVLACRGFPQCNGQWWPAMDFEHGFTVLHELGRAAHGGFLSFDALVAIHMSHRLFAVVAAALVVALSAALWREPDPAARRYARVLAALIVLQLASGLSNVVLDWPIAAALMHSGGAAALVITLVSLLARSRHAAAIEAVPAARRVRAVSVS